MRKLIYLMVFLLVALLTGTALAAPKLQAPEPSFDFGEITQGEKIRHVFVFNNIGDEILKIDRVRSSCGCTAALVSAKALEPGAQGEIQASFDSTRFSGSVSKTIYLYTNDPEAPTRQFHVKGKIREVVSIKPDQVNFGMVSPHSSAQAEVVIRNQGKETLKLGTPRSTAPELKVSMEKKQLEVGAEVVLKLKLTPKPGAPRFSGYVLIPVKNGNKKELRVPVYAAVKP